MRSVGGAERRRPVIRLGPLAVVLTPRREPIKEYAEFATTLAEFRSALARTPEARSLRRLVAKMADAMTREGR